MANAHKYPCSVYQASSLSLGGLGTRVDEGSILRRLCSLLSADAVPQGVRAGALLSTLDNYPVLNSCCDLCYVCVPSPNGAVPK